jgi:hypothetical protein
VTALVAIAALIAGATGCGGSDGGPPPASNTPSSTTPRTIKLETWMDGLSKNAEVDVSTMPDNVLYTVADKQPVAAPEAAAAPLEPGKVGIVYEEDPSKLQFLIESDPRFQAQQ